MATKIINGLKIELLNLKNRPEVIQHIRLNFNRDEPTLRSKLLCDDFGESDQAEIDDVRKSVIFVFFFDFHILF